MGSGRIAGLLAAASLAGLTASAAASPNTGIEGRIVDLSCPGPCVAGQAEKPFEGPAEVIVRRKPSREIVRQRTVEGGAFLFGVRAGRYSVRVQPYPDQPGEVCWTGSRQRVAVAHGEVESVRLAVRNKCLL
jgi:hypothetical protein